MTIENYQIFNQPAEWGGGVQLTYSMMSSVVSSQRYVEQRKAMRSKPVRNMQFNLLLSDSSTILNRLVASLQKIMYVPIVVEEIKVTANPTPPSPPYNWSVSVENTANLYNLRHITPEYVMVADKNDVPNTMVIAPLISVSDTVLVIQGETLVFEAGRTVIYPAMPAVLASLSKVLESAKLDTYSVEFDEYITGEDV